MLKIRFSVTSLLLLTTFIAVPFALFVLLAPGVFVTVRNLGDSSIHNVQVHVTGRSYSLGDFSSNEMKRCQVHPNGESHVEISYRLTDGTKVTQTVECYLEPGYRGALDADLNGSKLVDAAQKVHLERMGQPLQIKELSMHNGLATRTSIGP